MARPLKALAHARAGYRSPRATGGGKIRGDQGVVKRPVTASQCSVAAMNLSTMST
jgi:hypothetical protein